MIYKKGHLCKIFKYKTLKSLRSNSAAKGQDVLISATFAYMILFIQQIPFETPVTRGMKVVLYVCQIKKKIISDLLPHLAGVVSFRALHLVHSEALLVEGPPGKKLHLCREGFLFLPCNN